MDNEKIEETAKAIYNTGVAIDGTDIAFGVFDEDDHFHRMARKLYSEGYRKASDVIDEFANRLKQKMYYEFEEIIPSLVSDKIDELAAEMRKELEK